MKRPSILVPFTAMLLAAAISLPANGASKYKPCSLLTPAEVEVVLGSKVIKTDEGDGLYKGQTMSSCNWTTGAKVSAILTVTSGSGSPEAVWSAESRKLFDYYRAKGWTIDYANTRGAVCARGVPPAGDASSPAFAACLAESKGLSLSLNVVSPTVTALQVKGLFDKAVARLH
ncbi:MAG TPA: hypothetical protein VI007_07245 [bacterium]